MSQTKTEISNIALRRARENPVIGDVDTSDQVQAETVRDFYEQSLKETLQRIKPAFARKRAALTQDVTGPIFEYSYSYALPTDYVSIVKFNGATIQDVSDLFESEGRKVLTDEESANVVYVCYEEDTALYDPEFIEAFTLQLGANVSNALRGNTDLSTELYKLSEVAASNATSESSNGRRKPTIRDRVLAASHWAGISRRYSTNETQS